MNLSARSSNPDDELHLNGAFWDVTANFDINIAGFCIVAVWRPPWPTGDSAAWRPGGRPAWRGEARSRRDAAARVRLGNAKNDSERTGGLRFCYRESPADLESRRHLSRIRRFGRACLKAGSGRTCLAPVRKRCAIA